MTDNHELVLRDYFAAHAMHYYLTKYEPTLGTLGRKAVATISYDMADEMLAARLVIKPNEVRIEKN